MRLIWLGLFMLISNVAIAQQDVGNVVGNGGTNTGGGTSGLPQGAQGAGGTSDNLSAAFGERTNSNPITGFIGANANAQQGNFVGQNQTTINGPGGINGFGNGGRFGNQGGFQAGGRGGQGAQRQTPRRIRTRLVLPTDFAIEYRTVPRQKLQTTLSSQYRGIDSSQAKSKVMLGASRVFKNAQIEVVANGRTVTLRGQVRSDRERQLAARIAKLEPGVDRVENQLSVIAP